MTRSFVALSQPTLCVQIVATILSDPELTAEWKDELKIMSGRILQTRSMLVNELKKLSKRFSLRIQPLDARACALPLSDTPGDWSHITQQIGMFSYTGRVSKCNATHDPSVQA